MKVKNPPHKYKRPPIKVDITNLIGYIPSKKCVSCGETITCSHFTNNCLCGMQYNCVGDVITINYELPEGTVEYKWETLPHMEGFLWKELSETEYRWKNEDYELVGSFWQITQEDQQFWKATIEVSPTLTLSGELVSKRKLMHWLKKTVHRVGLGY